MAQKVTVALEDDLTGGPAQETVAFAFDGRHYEIDLNAKNAAALRKVFAPYLSTPAGPAGHSPPRRAHRGQWQRSGDIRAWAKEHGLAVCERGRIPASVVGQYHSASDSADTPAPSTLGKSSSGRRQKRKFKPCAGDA